MEAARDSYKCPDAVRDSCNCREAVCNSYNCLEAVRDSYNYLEAVRASPLLKKSYVKKLMENLFLKKVGSCTYMSPLSHRIFRRKIASSSFVKFSFYSDNHIKVFISRNESPEFPKMNIKL